MTLDQFIAKYLGKTEGYPEGQFVGECLSIVKLYIKECFGINPPPSGTNSAYGYWSNFPSPLPTVFEKVVNTDTLIPQKGWIAIWKPWASNQYGHIAIVADGSTTGTLKNWAQNWTSKKFQAESNHYTNVIGFLKPKLPVEDNMTEEQKKILQFLEEQKANEGKVREAFGALADLPTKEKQINILQTNAGKLQSQLDIATQVTDTQTKQIDTLKRQVINLQEKLDTSSIDSMNTASLFWEWIKRSIGVSRPGV